MAGPNVAFSSLDQMFTRTSDSKALTKIQIDLEMGDAKLRSTFERTSEGKLSIARTEYEFDLWQKGSPTLLSMHTNMTSDDIVKQIPDRVQKLASERADEFRSFAETRFSHFVETFIERFGQSGSISSEGLEGLKSDFEEQIHTHSWVVYPQRSFLTAMLTAFGSEIYSINPANHPLHNFAEALEGIIHVPAIRKKSFRNHPIANVQDTFPGTFEDYTASVVAKWQADNDSRFDRLVDTLQALDLTNAISATTVSDAEVELQIARPGQHRGERDPEFVSLADVGVGVSYVLPVLVSLEAAMPGQIVYIEQPESHLHPRAEYGLAEALVKAARRGVRVVAETHSSLLLLHIQTLVARGEIEATDVGLHWFTLDSEGFSNISFEQPDEHGRTGDWPEDFADIEMHASSEFIRAARRR